MTRAFRFTIVGAFLAAMAVPAGAQTQQQIDWCAKGGASADERISSCTAVIESGKYQGKNLAWAYNNRGAQYKKKGQANLALDDYNQSLRLDPSDTDTYYNRGNLYASKRDYDAALADYNRAIVGYDKARYPAYYKRDYYKARGDVFRKKGDYERAIADFNVAIQIDPNYARTYYNRGVAKLKIGDVAGSDADLAKARQLKPDIGEENDEDG